MRTQFGEVGQRFRIGGLDAVVEGRFEPLFSQQAGLRLFVGEQGDLGHETDVGQGHAVAHQIGAIRRQSALDTGYVSLERLLGAHVDVRGQRAAHQGQQIDLGIAGEDQAGVEEAVDARRGIGVAAVHRIGRLAEPPDRAHDAVRFENARLAVRAERRRNRAERMRVEKCVGLEQPAGEAGPRLTFGAPRRGSFCVGQRTRLEIP